MNATNETTETLNQTSLVVNESAGLKMQTTTVLGGAPNNTAALAKGEGKTKSVAHAIEENLPEPLRKILPPSVAESVIATLDVVQERFYDVVNKTVLFVYRRSALWVVLSLALLGLGYVYYWARPRKSI